MGERLDSWGAARGFLVGVFSPLAPIALGGVLALLLGGTRIGMAIAVFVAATAMLLLAVYFYTASREGDGDVIWATHAVSGSFVLFAVFAIAIVGPRNPLSWVLVVTAIGVVRNFPFSHFFATMVMTLVLMAVIPYTLLMPFVAR